MRIQRVTIGLFLFMNLVFCASGSSASKSEHRHFSRAALDSVLSECNQGLHDNIKTLFVRNDSLVIDTPLWKDKSFAKLSEAFSGKGLSPARSHKPKRTVLEQLEPLTPALIEKLWKAVTSKDSVVSVEQKNRNVVVNYVLHHLIALRFAHQAGMRTLSAQEDVRLAFIYEAMALSYVVDAFSSAQMLIDYKLFPCLQPFNYHRAHDFFSTEGAYVMNSKGDVWRAFGDSLMLWDEPTYRFTVDACVTSLRELFLVLYSTLDPNSLPPCLDSLRNSLSTPFSIEDWLEARPGGEYYAVLQMPSLLCLPMPISASWSTCSETVDEHGIHRRIHYPQLRESGYHDPDVEGVDTEFLLSKEAIPDWLLFDELKSNRHPDAAKEMIKTNPGVASVRYVQQRNYPPSYFGLTLNVAGGTRLEGDKKTYCMIGPGFGFADEVLFLNNVSVDVLYTDLFDSVDRQFITTTIGAGIHLGLPSPLHGLHSFRLEWGNAFETGNRLHFFHYKGAAGIEFSMLPVGFTYVGITSRLMVQRMYTDSAFHGVYFQIVVH